MYCRSLYETESVVTVAADVGACEYINNIKTKGDFEEQLHIEHSNVI